MRFSITTLVLLVGTIEAATPAAPAAPAYDFTSALTELTGEYKIKATDHQSSRPTWASVWSVGKDEQDFAVYFWPPKHCHAIYICVIPEALYDGTRSFSNFDCGTKYIKIFPHIGKLLFKEKDGATEEELFNQHYSLHFQHTNTGSTYTFKAQKEEAKDYKKWKEVQATLVEKSLDLKESHLLLLTNSRLCEVNKGGVNFHQVFDANTIATATHSKWPQWLSKHVGSPAYTDAFASYRKASTKKIDLLAYLKTDAQLNFTQAAMGKISQRCNSIEKVGIAGTTKPVFESSPMVSVASYKLGRSTETQSAGFSLKFELSVANCQWLRIWATDKQMDDYKTAMKPEDTLDIFFTEGFFVSPDEDQAKILPDARQIDKIKLLFYPDPESAQTNEAPLGEFAFGSHDGAYLFRQHFYSKSFGHGNPWFHVIKSPKCEASIVANDPYVMSGGTNELPNLLMVEDCQFGRFDDPRLVVKQA